MTTNGFGFVCEDLIRGLLPQVGVQHQWADLEDDQRFGIDCWICLRGVEVAVDFTVISKDELVQLKARKALERGVVPVFLDQSLLQRATDGNGRAIEEFGSEIRCQIPLKLPLLRKGRMTREILSAMKDALSSPRVPALA